ncbi:ribosome maturation factor RimP [Chitiniphilus eburneus]|uniref:Ribosome maturation factor RimP n=1 Tax=Chitiniphilus eburneus TaxID=2571148 RepID=A0A4U0Q273_9NEIS|nr:ribosome maturation factor RimP [Chitiniphilus eburneus]TJZ69794.1 ribosome maturation factor RimP [Chitiniphilus eburneus]
MAVNLQELLETTLTAMGYEMVDLEIGHNGLLRLFIDKPGGIVVEDCVHVSNHFTRLFMVENINYERLEVSSPGLDRVVKKPADFQRFAGEMVKVKLRLPLPDKRKRVMGKLLGLENEAVVIECDGERLALPLTHIDKVRLEPQF